jgi:phage shock protein E
MKQIAPLLAAAALAGALTGCSQGPTASAVEPVAQAAAGQPAPGRVGVTQFATIIAEPGVQIIDVRTPEEFADGHIQGAVNIPVQQSDFAERVAELDPNGTYAVYCRSGNRSRGAVAQMKDAGITTIYELGDGTIGWSADGQPLSR